MAPASALNLTVSQDDVFGELDDSSIKSVADGLLLAFQAPLTLAWETYLKDPNSSAQAAVKVSVQLGAEANAWPPGKFTLSVIPPRPRSGKTNLLSTSGFEVSSSVSATELAELLQVGCNFACPEPNADEDEEAAAENSAIVDGPSKDPAQEVALESEPGALQKPVAELPLVASDRCRGLKQALCLQQWHGNTCGHHALFNIRCLLSGHPERLQDNQLFWQSTLENIHLLVKHGEAAGSWPASRVTQGVADENHLRCLVESDQTLQGRVSFSLSAESLSEQLQNADSEMSLAINEIVSGRCQSHGFLLGAPNHWYAAVAIAIPSSDAALGQAVETQLIFCDSHNLPLVGIQNELDVQELTDSLAEKRRERLADSLRSQPEWEHRPKEHLEAACVEGLPEWWKGIKKSSLFWREQPLDVWMYSKKRELDTVRSYIHSLSLALGSWTPEAKCA